MALTIRHPRPEEDLAPFFPPEHPMLQWNLDQVYVADDGTRLVGLVAVFDGGHDVVMVDCVSVLSAWTNKGLWRRLLRHVCTVMGEAGKCAVIGYVRSPQAVILARYNGAKISSDPYRAVWQELRHG